jgi:hypothetical protein
LPSWRQFARRNFVIGIEVLNRRNVVIRGYILEGTMKIIKNTEITIFVARNKTYISVGNISDYATNIDDPI